MRVLIVSTLLTLTAAPAWSGTAIDEIADAHPRGEVEVSNVSGEIKVTGWNRSRSRFLVGWAMAASAWSSSVMADGP